MPKPTIAAISSPWEVAKAAPPTASPKKSWMALNSRRGGMLQPMNAPASILPTMSPAPLPARAWEKAAESPAHFVQSRNTANTVVVARKLRKQEASSNQNVGEQNKRLISPFVFS